MKWLIAFIMAIVTSRRRKISGVRCSGYLRLLQTDVKQYVLKGRAFYILKEQIKVSHIHIIL